MKCKGVMVQSNGVYIAWIEPLNLDETPIHTPFHTNSNEMHDINRIKLILHPNKPDKLWESGKTGVK